MCGKELSNCYFSQGPSGLGFAIVEETRGGRQGIYVRSITYGGVADRDGQLSVGDQILEVQDKSLTSVHYDKVCMICDNAFRIPLANSTNQTSNVPLLDD